MVVFCSLALVYNSLGSLVCLFFSFCYGFCCFVIFLSRSFQFLSRNLFWCLHLLNISVLLLSWSFLLIIIIEASVRHNLHILLPFCNGGTCLTIFQLMLYSVLFFFSFYMCFDNSVWSSVR